MKDLILRLIDNSISAAEDNLRRGAQRQKYGQSGHTYEAIFARYEYKLQEAKDAKEYFIKLIEPEE